ncbi:hypothetical protein LSH36_345g00012 [Paralvinella palmiformis]|uniref:Endonuclease/exonuclease/phosphatase domain-containing protein n=1 Tax=Paralvinella palmiformis TaxID=53620 RepID=A0AAD9MZU7_9ANNE|nr:hypothetical protein LSH36_345g00012 [Paralvinella palmiformis]
MRPRSGKHPKQIGSDALVITETWLTGNVSDQKIVGDVTPAGYSFHHAARIHKKGGGVGILLRDSLKSFENYQLTFISGGISVRVAIIYRLHPTKKNCPKAADFFKEFSGFFYSLPTNSGHLLMLGDFNIHWDCQRNADTKQLADILRSANLRQHVQERTHRHGHILDLAISRDEVNLIKAVSASSMLSDHFLVNINLSLQKQSVSAKVISYRRYKSIDKESFLADLRVSSLVLDPPDDVDHLVDLYDNTLRDIVDQHAPLRTKEMPSRPMLPWYNKNIQAAKRHRRYCERLWIRTSLCVHFEMFKSAYKSGHSTETVLVRVKNDIMMSIDQGFYTFESCHHVSYDSTKKGVTGLLTYLYMADFSSLVSCSCVALLWIFRSGSMVTPKSFFSVRIGLSTLPCGYMPLGIPDQVDNLPFTTTRFPLPERKFSVQRTEITYFACHGIDSDQEKCCMVMNLSPCLSAIRGCATVKSQDFSVRKETEQLQAEYIHIPR